MTLPCLGGSMFSKGTVSIIETLVREERLDKVHQLGWRLLGGSR